MLTNNNLKFAYFKNGKLKRLFFIHTHKTLKTGGAMKHLLGSGAPLYKVWKP